MATKPLEVKLLQASHWVELERNGDYAIRKEEIYARLASSWRGVEVQIEAVLQRYRHSNGLSDWRLYSAEVRAWSEPRNGFYDDVSDVARQRLREACEPVVMAYTTSDDYANTFHAALVRAISYEAERERYEPANLTRRMVGAWAMDLRSDVCGKFEHLAKQFEAMSEAVSALNDGESQTTVYVPSSRFERVTS